MKLIKVLALTACLSAPLASQAALTLRVENVTTPCTYTTTATLDNSATALALGAYCGWTVNATGLGVDLLADDPDFMDLSSVVFSSSGAGRAKISFTQTDLTSAYDLQNFLAHIGGTVNGSLVASLLIDPTNAAFGGASIWSDSATSGAFAMDGSGFADNLSGPYSATLLVDVTHSGRTQSSWDMSARRIPEPATLGLLGLGLGLAGLAGLRRRKQ